MIRVLHAPTSREPVSSPALTTFGTLLDLVVVVVAAAAVARGGLGRLDSGHTIYPTFGLTKKFRISDNCLNRRSPTNLLGKLPAMMEMAVR